MLFISVDVNVTIGSAVNHYSYATEPDCVTQTKEKKMLLLLHINKLVDGATEKKKIIDVY